MSARDKAAFSASGPAAWSGAARPVYQGGGGGEESPRTYDFTGGTLPPGASLTRASIGTRFNSSGLLVTESADAPRFDYSFNGSVWTLAGLLVEPQRTNVLVRSNILNAQWSGPGSNGQINTGKEDLAGGSTGHSVEDISAAGECSIVLSVTFSISAGEKCWMHAYFKQQPGKETDQLTFGGRMIGGTAAWWMIGYVFSTQVAAAVNAAPDSIEVTPLDSGWYHVKLMKIAVSGNSGTSVDIRPTKNGPAFFSAVGEMLVQQVQVEKSDYPTSSITTAGSAVTRSADMLILDLADGNWDLEVVTPNDTFGGSVTVSDGYHFAWGDLTGATAERHLRSITATPA